MKLSALGIKVRERRDAGSHDEYHFSFPSGAESSTLVALLEAMTPGQELSVPDPSNGDCSLEVRRGEEGYEVRRGCHGASGTWRPASLSESHSWLLPGVVWAAGACPPGYGASFTVPK